MGPLTVDLYIAALPDITVDLSASDSAVQLTLTGSLAGLAVGQLLVGPLSDSWGRRRPLLVALAGYLVGSLLCALAPSALVLVLARALQGLAGGAALVVSLAVVRDTCSGRAAVRLLSQLAVVSGVAPIVAPALGSVVLRWTSWRGVFALLALAGAGLVLAVVRGLPESLPPPARREGGVRATASACRLLLADRCFTGLALAGSLLLAAMFAYIAESPFVYQRDLGLSAQEFGLLFGLNAAGILLGGQLSLWLVPRVERLHRIVLVAGPVMLAGAACVLLAASTGWGGLWALNAPILVMMVSLGAAMPTATALALAPHPGLAGTAAALLGSTRFLGAALAAPVVGVVPGRGPVPMALVMLAATATAVAVLAVVRRDVRDVRADDDVERHVPRELADPH